jgi:putative Mn2+ efflux pump MntP
MALAAGLSAATAYLHGLMGAVLAERHIEHVASWAGSVAFFLTMVAVGLAIMAGLIRDAETQFARAKLEAENLERWELSKQAQLTDGTTKKTEIVTAAVQCDEAETPQLEAP